MFSPAPILPTSERRLRDPEPAITLIRRGLNALGIELIPARSPQAKRRVERLFGTLQDRLPKEMRLAGIDSRVHESLDDSHLNT